MKILISLALLLYPFIASYSQDSYDEVAQLTCACAKKKNMAAMPKQETQTALGLCIFDAINEYEASGKKLNLNIGDQTAMQAFGTEVGKRMVSRCPELMMKLVQTETTETAVLTEISGTVSRVECGELCQIVLKEPSGREYKMLWIHYFKGSDAYLANPQKLVARKLKVKYKEVEYYSSKLREYYKGKEVMEIEEQAP
jgi:hypothetical protein